LNMMKIIILFFCGPSNIGVGQSRFCVFSCRSIKVVLVYYSRVFLRILIICNTPYTFLIQMVHHHKAHPSQFPASSILLIYLFLSYQFYPLPLYLTMEAFLQGRTWARGQSLPNHLFVKARFQHVHWYYYI